MGRKGKGKAELITLMNCFLSRFLMHITRVGCEKERGVFALWILSIDGLWWDYRLGILGNDYQVGLCVSEWEKGEEKSGKRGGGGGGEWKVVRRGGNEGGV